MYLSFSTVDEIRQAPIPEPMPWHPLQIRDTHSVVHFDDTAEIHLRDPEERTRTILFGSLIVIMIIVLLLVAAIIYYNNEVRKILGNPQTN